MLPNVFYVLYFLEIFLLEIENQRWQTSNIDIERRSRSKIANHETLNKTWHNLIDNFIIVKNLAKI